MVNLIWETNQFKEIGGEGRVIVNALRESGMKHKLKIQQLCII